MTAIARHVPRVTVGLVLLGAAALHLNWARGSHWPARSRDELAIVVSGSPELPSPVACAVVGVALTGAATSLLVGPAIPGGRVLRMMIALGLGVRGLAGGEIAARALKLPEPLPRFVTWDRRFYRPLCLLLAVFLAMGEALKPRPAV